MNKQLKYSKDAVKIGADSSALTIPPQKDNTLLKIIGVGVVAILIYKILS